MEEPILTTDPKITILQKSSKWALTAARVAFATEIVLMPVRYRIVLAARPVPLIYRDYTDFLLFPSDIALLCMLTLWVLSLVLRPRRLDLGPRVIWIPLAGLTLAGWATTITSLDPLLAVYHAIRLVALFWFYVFIVNEIQTIRWVVIPVGVQLLSQSAVALGQFLTQHSIGLRAIGEAVLDPARAGTSIVAVGGARLLRAYGLTDHPNILGGCLAFGLLLLLPYYLRSRVRWITLAVLSAAGAALLVTFSRSAWLAFVLGCAVLLVLDVVRRRRLPMRNWLVLGAGWLVLSVPIFLAYPRFFGVRLNAGNSFSSPSVEQQSIGERVLLLESAASMISAHPLLGVGLGGAPLALKAYRPDWTVVFEPPHAAVVDAALEVGVPGAAFYLALVIAPFFIYFTQQGRLNDEAASAAALALLLGIAVAGLFDYYTWMLAPGRLWQWLAWGLWALASRPGMSLLPSRQPAEIDRSVLAGLVV